MRRLFSTKPVQSFLGVYVSLIFIVGTTTGSLVSLLCVHKDSCGGDRKLDGFEVTYFCKCNPGMSGLRCEHTFHHPTSHHAKVLTGDALGRTKIAVRVDGHGEGEGYASLEGDRYCYNATANCLRGVPVFHTHALCSGSVKK